MYSRNHLKKPLTAILLVDHLGVFAHPRRN